MPGAAARPMKLPRWWAELGWRMIRRRQIRTRDEANPREISPHKPQQPSTTHRKNVYPLW